MRIGLIRREDKPIKPKQEIIKTIESISGKYSPYQVFSDWVECSALAVANSCTMNHSKIWQEREKSYKDLMSRYELEERRELRDMFHLLAQALDE